MDDRVTQELIRVSHDWDRSMVANDPDAIGRYMADEWVIIGSDGSVGDKNGFLALVRSGDLSHDVMETYDLNVRIYGETAVLSARGMPEGKYRGQRFHEIERVSCVFVRQSGQWRCVLTHLSRLAQDMASHD